MATFTILHANSYILNLIYPQLRPQPYTSTATPTVLYIHGYTHNNALHPQLHPQWCLTSTAIHNPTHPQLHPQWSLHPQLHPQWCFTSTATLTKMLYIHSDAHNPVHPQRCPQSYKSTATPTMMLHTQSYTHNSIHSHLRRQWSFPSTNIATLTININ